MEAKVLLCNWCKAKGKAVFATTHAVVELSGVKHQTYQLDGCVRHARRFLRSLRVASAPLDDARKMLARGAVTIDDIRLPMLQYIAKAKAPVGAPALFGAAAIPGRIGTQKNALRAFRAEGLVEMHGTKGRARYTLTPKGRATAQKKRAPAAAATSAPSEKRAARRLRRPRRGHRG
jgi:hypothetical protein